KHAADVLESRDFQNRLAAALSTGISFAAARDHAADLGGLLKYPNSNLGIEYILAAKRIGANFQFEAFPRRGTGHNADTPDPSLGFASGSYLRGRLLAGDFDACKPYIPTEMLSLLKPEEIADLRRLERAVLTVLRGKSAAQLKRLPDLSEGLENKLFSSISLAKSLDELYNRTKGKRYSHARIRRLVLSAFLGLDSFYFLREPPYTKVLGFSREGEQVLKKAVSDSPFPFLIRTSDCVALSNSAKELFDLELKAADFYALAFEPPKQCGTELTAKLYKTEC
ncbi:MAG: nucleotidyltransferase family protein, partial [Clostridia bacterium]|nr:nucleotidyltransferase family protein [Clostridia bacterium]